jgi:hypothetical protein
MARHDSYAGDVKQNVQQAAQQAVGHPWFAYLARMGYAAKGAVYLLAGVLTARAAFGLGGQATDKQAALRAVLAEPLGKFLLIVIVVGLLGYVLLRLAQAIMDPERKGADAKGIAQRIGYLISALLYAGLAVSALRLIMGAGDSSDPSRSWVARIFALPLGRWLVALVGLIVIGGGLYQLYKAYSADFSEHFRWDAMSAHERTGATALGRIGLAARGIVQGLIGIFLIQAALKIDSNQVQGSGGALQSLAGLIGPWAVGVVAVGLAAYGVYMLAAARYGRIVTR